MHEGVTELPRDADLVVLNTAMGGVPWAWVYFVSFVLIGTFVVLNLFIAVVINNLETSKAEQLEAVYFTSFVMQ